MTINLSINNFKTCNKKLINMNKKINNKKKNKKYNQQIHKIRNKLIDIKCQ